MPTPLTAAPEAETQVLGTRARQRTGPVAFDSIATLTRRSDKRRVRGRWLVAVVAVLAILAGTTGWYFGSGPGSKVIIPSVEGTSVSEATTELESADLVVADKQRQEFSVKVPDGKVIGTDPAAGESVAHGGTVSLIVSKGPKSLEMPLVVGMTEEDARAALGDSFDIQESKYLFNSEVPEGSVISAAGVDLDGNAIDLGSVTEYWEGQPVTLTVSLGPIPDVKGLSVEDAQQALSAKDLVGSTSDGLHAWSDDVPKGSVIGVQVPEGAKVTKGTELQVIVSDGIEQVEIPDVVGKNWTEAKPILEEAGFAIVLEDTTSTALALTNPDAAIVTKLTPKAGTTADKGSTVKVKLRADD